MTIDDVLDYLLPDDWRSHPTTTTTCRARRPRDASLTRAAYPIARRKEDRQWHALTRRHPPRLPQGPARPAIAARAAAASRDRFGRFTECDRPRAWARRGSSPACRCSVVVWLVFNTSAPEDWRFDSAAIGFTALTLILSLQASYAAPLILLAQNRQDDRDRVQIEQDRQRAERNLADTEYLAREVVALRLAIKDMASKDFIRAELRACSRSSTSATRRRQGPVRDGAERRRDGADAGNSEQLRGAGPGDRPRDPQAHHRARHGRAGQRRRTAARARRHQADDRRMPGRRPHRARRARGRSTAVARGDRDVDLDDRRS